MGKKLLGMARSTRKIKMFKKIRKTGNIKFQIKKEKNIKKGVKARKIKEKRHKEKIMVKELGANYKEELIKKIKNKKNIKINEETEKIKENYLFEKINNQECSPWMTPETKKIKNSHERFDNEIEDFVNFITPHGPSLKARQNTIELLKKAIKKQLPNWEVLLYGSFSQGISTIFSDLDFSLCDKGIIPNDLFKFKKIINALEKEHFSEDFYFIKGKIPIITGTCYETGIRFDISYNKKEGFETAKKIRNIIEKNKIIKQAMIILKILLKNNKLNETYEGGMCSFLLFHLVYYFYIKEDSYLTISQFLFSFLEFYGKEFDYRHLSLSIKKKKTILKKNGYEEKTISVESIENEDIDIGLKCREYNSIVELFQTAYDRIKEGLERGDLSILELLPKKE